MDIRSKAKSALNPRGNLSQGYSINKGIGYALLYIGDQLKELVQAKEKNRGFVHDDEIETKG